MNSRVNELLDTQPTVFFFYLEVKSGPQDDGTLPTPVVISLSPLRESPILVCQLSNFRISDERLENLWGDKQSTKKLVVQGKIK